MAKEEKMGGQSIPAAEAAPALTGGNGGAAPVESAVKSENAELPAVNGGRKAGGRRTTSAYKKLATLLERYRGQGHLVILLGTPDPDAISSALALGALGEPFDIDTTLLCFTGVSHHENRALVKRLGLNLVKYDPDFDLSAYAIYSIVDSQKYQTPIDARLVEHGIEFFAFVDHHREDSNPPPAQFVDIRQQAASTAAIFCEYLREAYVNGLSPSDPAQVTLATALMHGLRSDTAKFLLATQLEFEAAAFLAPCVDTQVIEVIERKVLTPSMLDMFENAMVNRRIHDNFIFSDVGYVRASDRDAIPQIAELLLAREGTDTVLVFGIVDELTIDGSMRTRSETINPDEFLKAVLGVSPESGKYYGGGNIRDRGGFQIPLGFFSLHEDKGQIYTMARQIIEKSFLDYIGKAGSRSRKTGSAG